MIQDAARVTAYRTLRDADFRLSDGYQQKAVMPMAATNREGADSAGYQFVYHQNCRWKLSIQSIPVATRKPSAWLSSATWAWRLLHISEPLQTGCPVVYCSRGKKLFLFVLVGCPGMTVPSLGLQDAKLFSNYFVGIW